MPAEVTEKVEVAELPHDAAEVGRGHRIDAAAEDRVDDDGCRNGRGQRIGTANRERRILAPRGEARAVDCSTEECRVPAARLAPEVGVRLRPLESAEICQFKLSEPGLAVFATVPLKFRLPACGPARKRSFPPATDNAEAGCRRRTCRNCRENAGHKNGKQHQADRNHESTRCVLHFRYPCRAIAGRLASHV